MTKAVPITLGVLLPALLLTGIYVTTHFVYVPCNQSKHPGDGLFFVWLEGSCPPCPQPMLFFDIPIRIVWPPEHT